MECADILKDIHIQGETSDDSVCAQTLQKEHLEVQSAWIILILKTKNYGSLKQGRQRRQNWKYRDNCSGSK